MVGPELRSRAVRIGVGTACACLGFGVLALALFLLRGPTPLVVAFGLVGTGLVLLGTNAVDQVMTENEGKET